MSSATDLFPLSVQKLLIDKLFNKEAAHAWIESGLGGNVFLAPTRSEQFPQFVRFRSGQPLGFLSSWPLFVRFALSHHFLVWLAADEVYPERKFTNYALLGDDIVIADKKVAECYFDMLLG